MKYIEKIKTQIKSILTTITYMAGIGLLVYAIVFAVKKRTNGNNVAVNLLIGLVDGVAQTLNFTFGKWLEEKTPLDK